MTARPKRQPKGMPVGGQFSSSSHDEAELALDESGTVTVCENCHQAIPSRDFLEHDLYCNEDGDNMDADFVYPGKLADTLAAQCEAESDYASENGLLFDGFERSWTLADTMHGTRYSEELFDRFDGDLDAAMAVTDREWGRVVNSVPKEQQALLRRKLVERDVKPSDFDSKDDDVAMWAGSVRGDVTFGGVITSNGYALSSYAEPFSGGEDALRGRVLAPPVGDVSSVLHKRWDDLSTAEQVSYVDGYASATVAIAHCRSVAASDPSPRAGEAHSWARVTMVDRGLSRRVLEVPGEDGERALARQAGWHRAIDAAMFEDMVADGTWTVDRTVQISESDAVGRGVNVRGVTKLTGPGSAGAYEGRVGADARRVGRDGSTIPWTEGAHIRFTVDQVLGNGVAQ